MAEGETPIENREGLWGLLLGNRFDRVAEENQNLRNLTTTFCENKREIVRYYHDSVGSLVSEIETAEADDAEATLLFLWAEHEWRNKRTGTKFRIGGTLEDELRQLENNDNIVRQLDERFALVWTPEDKRRYLKESDSIRSTIQTEARPVFIKTSLDSGEVEVRGSSRLLRKFTEEFSKSDEVDEVEPEPTEEPISEEFSSLFEADMSALTLVGARFSSTNLPDGSSITIDNPEGINEDLRDSDIQPTYVDISNIAELDYIKFKHEKSGNQVKLSVVEDEEGFHFDVDDSNISEDEKKNIREILESKIGVSLDKLYPYDTQHHRDYIINRILAENEDIYRRYFSKLDNEAQEFVEKHVDASGQDSLYCYECHEGYLQFDKALENCPECGTTLMRGEPSMSLELREDVILDSVAKEFHNFSNDIRGADGTRLLELDFRSAELSDNQYLKSTFHLAETAGSASDMHWYEFFNYCLGNGDIPQRVNEYLLDTVLITYGKSEISGRENFGTINLFDLLTGDNPESQFVKAIRASRSKLRDRVRDSATEAQERLQDIQQMVNDGTIAEASYEKRQELKSEYDHNDFERDIFYIFKTMFLFTERWGREGKKETDGCLIIPDGKGEYFVASYDPKLTYDISGYDLDADEKNKAAYYILSENNHTYISDHLKDGGPIDGHIFVSDIFKHGQFEHVADSVQNWFSLTKSGTEGIDVPLIFLSLESLLSLYEVFDSNFNFIIEYRQVQKAFRSEIQNQFSATNQYVVVDDSSVEKVKERVLEARSKARKKKSIKEFSEN